MHARPATLISGAALIIATAVVWPTRDAKATTVQFDFDTGTPTLVATESIPTTGLLQTSGGVTATFIPQFAPNIGFSIQSDSSTQFNLSKFFSSNYVYPDSLSPGFLDIQFSQTIRSISLSFATADLEAETEIPANLQLTGFQNSKATPVGSATAHGAYLGDTWPEGTLSFSSAQPFNLVELVVPLPASTADFFVDNIIVDTAENVVPLPAALPLFATGLGALGLLGWRRKRKAAVAA